MRPSLVTSSGFSRGGRSVARCSYCLPSWMSPPAGEQPDLVGAMMKLTVNRRSPPGAAPWGPDGSRETGGGGRRRPGRAGRRPPAAHGFSRACGNRGREGEHGGGASERPQQRGGPFGCLLRAGIDPRPTVPPRRRPTPRVLRRCGHPGPWLRQADRCHQWRRDQATAWAPRARPGKRDRGCRDDGPDGHPGHRTSRPRRCRAACPLHVQRRLHGGRRRHRGGHPAPGRRGPARL